MIESVTDIIVARSRQPEGLKAMVLWSLAGHVVVLSLAILWPAGVVQARREPVMTVSLGGAPGPRSGGLTQLGARAVQPPPPDAPTTPAATPPAPVPPKMTLPDPRERPRTQPKPQQAPPASTAKTPSTATQPVEGSARADTGVPRGQGFGLSTAGGSGGPVQLDVSDFCCRDYVEQMVAFITRSWDGNQGVPGSTTVKFTILRDGTIQPPQLEKSSGFIALDSTAMRAVQLTRLPPLPAAFPNPTLTVHMRFDYQR